MTTKFLETDLHYNDETHTYSLPGVGVIPGPSLVLDTMGFVSDFAKNSPKACRFGHNVHKMVELDLKDDLDTKTLSDGLSNAFVAWKKFRDRNRHLIPLLERVERPTYHPVYLYAGMPDLPMYEMIRGRVVYHLVDIKSGCWSEHYRLQTAAYVGIERYWLNVRPTAPFKRSILFLNDRSDEPKLMELKDNSDWNAWLNTLGCYNWKKHNGYISK